MVLSNKVKGIAPSLTLKITSMAKEMKAQGKDVIGFGAGEPDFDTPEFIKNAAKEALDNGLTKYTAASGTPELKQAVCDRYKRKYGLSYMPNQVIISNGAKHSLYNAFQAILNPGDEVIIISPYWLTYPELVKMADGVPIYVEAFEQNNFRPVIDDVKAAITDKTKAIILNSPSNPCGCVYDESELKGIADLAIEHDLIIVADEIYDELVYGVECKSIVQVEPAVKDRTIIVNGMSKAYSMTGWRIGYTLSDPQIAKLMGSLQSHATSNPCTMSQYASLAALNGDETEIKYMVSRFAQRRDLITRLINEIDGLSCRAPQGAFYVMMNISGVIGKSLDGEVIKDSISFTEILLKNALISVVPGVAFGADEYVRLSYALSDENITKGIARIAEFVKKLK